MAKLPASSSSFALDFLRRLLCAHSTGNNAQRDAPGQLSAPEPEGRSPCIVARLMGLDAMPAAEAQPQQELLRRSRSASYCGDIDGAAPPPAVRPPASLREKPAYLRAENDMFLLLSFSPEEERDATKKADYDEEAARRRENRTGGGGAGRKERRPHRRKLQFGDDEDDDDDSSGRRRRRECNNAPQSSSPVSVLEAQRDAHEESSTTTTTTTSSSLEDVDTSEEAHLFASEQQSSSARKPRTSFVQLDDMSPAATSTVHASRCSDRERSNRRTTVANQSDASTPDVSGIWQPVCRLVEEDLKSTEWLTRHAACASNVVVAEMGSEILDQLVCEATAELVRLCSDAVSASPLPLLTDARERARVQETFRQDKGRRILNMRTTNAQSDPPSGGVLHSEICRIATDFGLN